MLDGVSHCHQFRPEVERCGSQKGHIKSSQCPKLAWTCAFFHQRASWLQWLPSGNLT